MNKSTLSTTTINGIPVTIPNVVKESKGFYVSYNNYDTGIYGCDTTAIVKENPTVFLILDGDHRDALDGKTLEESIAYFHEHKHLMNKMSDPDEDFVFKF